jgi:hypothetical protein
MSLTRRCFAQTLCGLPLSSLLRAAATDDFSDFAQMPWNAPATVARVYLAGQPHWPKPTLDIEQEVRDIEANLAGVARKHAANVRFTGGEILHKDGDVRPWLDQTGPVDGLLIIPLTQPTPALRVLLDESNVPALFFSRPYATHSWSAIAGLRKAGRKLDVAATSSYGDLDPYLRMFRTAHHMKTSKVLVGAATPKGREEAAAGYSKSYGTRFQFVTGNEFKDAFNATDQRLARAAAEEFTRNALRVIEPKPQEIEDGLRMYLAMKEMLKREQANALTIDCFGTLAANTLPGYPCIAWSKFNDAGLYGVCEGDLHSTMTQLLVTSYSGVPGFVSDPVFDVSRNEVIHAHCVSATRMKGPHGPASPYIVRDHLETHEGAVMQVLMPCDETITVARFNGPGRLLVSTAFVTGYGDSDRGCRTQIRTRVSDAEKWLQNFQAGLHRVIFYGDHTRAIERMGRLMGFEVVAEI